MDDVLRAILARLAVLIAVEDVTHCEDYEGKAEADKLAFAAGRLLQLDHPEFK